MKGYSPLPEPTPIFQQKWPEGTEPLLTTRTMTFNHEAFIGACIEGILIQKTTFPVQVLIHDDASTDGTVQILKEYEKKYPSIVRVFYQPFNTHTSSKKQELRQDFFNLIKGKYIALCEGDDYWTLEYKLQHQVQYLEANPKVSLTFHDFKRSDGKKSIALNKFPPLVENDVYVLKLKEVFSTQIQTLTLVYRNVVKRPIGIKILNGDALLIALLVEKGEVAYLNFEGAFYRIHGGGIHAGNSKYKRIQNSINSRKKMLSIFKQPIKGQLYLRLSYFYKELAKIDFHNKKYFQFVSNLVYMFGFYLIYIMGNNKE